MNRPLLTLLALLLSLGLGCSTEPPANDDDATDDDDSSSDDDDSSTDDDDDDSSADDDDDKPVTLAFEGGWSFGHCAGLCWGNAALFSDGALDYVLGSWTDTDSWDLSTTMTASGFTELGALIDAVDSSSLDPVYGCPDCADGGAKEMTWHDTVGPATTTAFEFGLPPAVLVDLDTAMTAVMNEASTCTFTYWLTDPGDCVPVP